MADPNIWWKDPDWYSFMWTREYESSYMDRIRSIKFSLHL
jgi:hypothetical protein